MFSRSPRWCDTHRIGAQAAHERRPGRSCVWWASSCGPQGTRRGWRSPRGRRLDPRRPGARPGAGGGELSIIVKGIGASPGRGSEWPPAKCQPCGGRGRSRRSWCRTDRSLLAADDSFRRIDAAQVRGGGPRRRIPASVPASGWIGWRRVRQPVPSVHAAAAAVRTR